MNGANGGSLQRSNIDQLTKSLEKLSIYDGQGRVKVLQVSAKTDFERILGDLNMDTIGARLEELHARQQEAIAAENLDAAERVDEEIKELREKEILLKNFVIIEQNQKSFEDLRKFNEKQIADFNNKWENIIFEITEYSKKIERDLVEQHGAERQRLEEGIHKVQVPSAKYSADLLNQKFKLRQMIKSKKFENAKEAKMEIEVREENEREDWIRKFHTQLEKRKELLATRHKNEYQALKTRLEKTINAKLKQRMADYEKLLQRIQNLQNEMIIKQSLQFSKIQATNAKLLAKYALNLADLEEKFVDPVESVSSKALPRAAPKKRPTIPARTQEMITEQELEHEESENTLQTRPGRPRAANSALDAAKTKLKQSAKPAPTKTPVSKEPANSVSEPKPEVSKKPATQTKTKPLPTPSRNSADSSSSQSASEQSEEEDDAVPVSQLLTFNPRA